MMLKGATVIPEKKTEAADSWNRLLVAVRVPAARRASKNASMVGLEPELVVGKDKVIGADDSDGGEGALSVEACFQLTDVVGEEHGAAG